MRLFSNVRVYDRVGGLYDAALGFWSRGVRRRAAGALDLREDERLLIVGVGTGMELEHLPTWVRGAGVDLSDRMLERARRRRAELGMDGLDLRVMDARRLDFPDGAFEAVYLPLILTVVEDGARVLAEAARVAAPGGRLVVADRFWPEGRRRPAPVRAAAWVLGHLAMRFDRCLPEMLAGAPSLKVEEHVRVAPGAFFHLVTLRKPGPQRPGQAAPADPAGAEASAFGARARRVARSTCSAPSTKGGPRTMNAGRILDFLAVIFVGDGLLWVLAPRRRGLLWMAGPGFVRRFVEGVTLERPWLGRLIGAAQAVVGVWMALRAYSKT